MSPELTSPPPRANQGIGIAFMLLGGAAMAFSAFSLLIALLQALLFTAIDAPDDDVAVMLRALWSLWRLHMPIWFLGGIGFVICGRRLRALRPGAVALARLACMLAVIALVAYGADCWIRVMPVWEPAFSAHPVLPGVSFRYFMAASMVTSLAPVTVPFGVLFWSLRTRPS